MTLPDGGLISAQILWDEIEDPTRFPFSVPAIRATESLDLSTPVTFFVGENGSGKSTLLEAIVIAAGVNAEGGTRNLRFSTRPTESSLHERLKLVWRTRQSWAFFLRAETFFDMAKHSTATHLGYFGEVFGRSREGLGQRFSDSTGPAAEFWATPDESTAQHDRPSSSPPQRSAAIRRSPIAPTPAASSARMRSRAGQSNRRITGVGGHDHRDRAPRVL